MAVAYGAVSNTTWANRVDTVVTPPAGIANGHLLLLFHVVGSLAVPTPIPPAGFALVPGTWPADITDGTYTMSTRVWYKVASGESGSYTISHTVADTQAVMVRLTGQHATTIFPSLASGNPTVNRHRAPGDGFSDVDLTTFTNLGPTVVDGGLVVLFGWDWGDTGNDLIAPTDGAAAWTERLDVAPLSFVATAPKGPGDPSGPNTGTATMQQNSSPSSPWGGMLLYVAPGTGGPPAADISGTASGTGGATGTVSVSTSRAGPSLVNTSAQMTASGNRQSIKQHNEAAGGIPWLPTVLPGDKLFTSAQTSSTGAQGVGQAGVMIVNTSAQMTSTGFSRRLGSSVVLTRAVVTFKPSGTKDAPFLNPPTDAIIQLYVSDAIMED